ncbi:coiled-coil domain-containing protein 3a isoform X1 [Paramormyrops kingsleyae]|uniref:Coiled-coil domain containing 3a n=1 Tax=Paramormyrops kingsleyae TaxID=1676925 RepID=A0A3B3S3Z9_9TELE|nr:coiled-coil domain-containing protein 3 isoform X1 [Paramormyrops kingsleyae]XP_023654803.1 coiled-coil domain-containing protein 3 isoform X1 [Paramormyrops kingsleyae]
MLPALLLTLGCVIFQVNPGFGCQLPTEWRPLSESCRAELAEIIVYARVLAIHQEVYGANAYNHLPYQYDGTDDGLFYSAEIELLCDQAWGSMLEVPAGSRLNITGLGYFSCQSHTVVQNYSYIFFLRMDENYNILPHGVNFQDAIFPDTQENRRIFSSLFQFSNCSHGQPLQTFTPDWEIQEDNRLLCSSMQLALFEEEEHVKKLQERLAQLEDKNRQLKERVRKVKRSLQLARRDARRAQRDQQQLQELLASSQRAGHHLNAIQQDSTPYVLPMGG